MSGRTGRYYSRFWLVPSESREGVIYKVSERSSDGGMECSCPHWIYRRAQCKHIQAVQAGFIPAGPRITDVLNSFAERRFDETAVREAIREATPVEREVIVAEARKMKRVLLI